MDALFRSYTFTSTDLPWVTLAVFSIAFVAFALALIYRGSKLDRTGWEREIEEEIANEPWRRYSLEPFIEPGSLPKRVGKHLIRDYLRTWYGALHGLVLVFSAVPAIGFALMRQFG